MALELLGNVAATDGAHPSALREMTIDLDRDIALDPRGLPVCRLSGRDIRRPKSEVEKLCHEAIVGGGRMDFEIALPEQSPTQTRSKAVIINVDATKGTVASLLVVAALAAPIPPVVIVMPIEVTRKPMGSFGLHAVAKLPVVAGGSGSLLDFKLKLRRLFHRRGSRKSFLTARCPDGGLSLNVPKLLFRNEAHTPGVASTTVIGGSLVVPCSPAG